MSILKSYLYNFGLLLGAVLSTNLSAQQGPANLNISGVLYSPNGVAISQSNVNFQIEILDQGANCVLFSEQHNAVDLAPSKGAFSLMIGTGTQQTNNLQGTTTFSSTLFQNTGAIAPFTGCPAGVTLSPGSDRVIRVAYDLGHGLTTMTPDVPITSAPYAMVAETVQGKSPTDFILTNNSVNSALVQANVETIFTNNNYPKLLDLINGVSNQYIQATPGGPVNFNNQLLTGVADPTAAQDAATKNYADTNIGGFGTNISGIGPGVGQGKTLIWDAAQDKWVASAVGSVASVTAGSGLTGGTITNTGTLAVDTGTTANKIIQLDANAQLPGVDAFFLTNVNAVQLQSHPVSASAPSAGQVFMFNGTTSVWEPQTPTGGTITALHGDVAASGSGDVAATIQNNVINAPKINSGYGKNQLLITDNTTGQNIGYATCATGQILQWTPGGWACTDVSVMLGTPGTATASAGTATAVSQVSIDAQGRVTSLTNVNIAYPVTSVAGRTGDVTLNSGDIGGLGTAATKDAGNLTGNVPTLANNNQLPALDGFLLSNVNASFLQSHAVSAANPTAGQVLGWNNNDSQWEPVFAAVGTLTQVQTGNGLTGGPITTIGTISVNAGTGANQIVQLDNNALLPIIDGSALTNINAVRIGTHTISTANPSPGQYIGWNTSTSQWEPMATVSGTVTNITTGNGLLGGPISSTGTLSVNAGVGSNQIVQMTPSAQYPVADGNLISNINAVKLQTRDVSAQAPNPGQVLGWNVNDSLWEPMSVTSGTVTSVNSGTGLLGGPFSNTGTLSVDVGTAANQILQLDVNAKVPAVDGYQLSNLNATRIGTHVIATSNPSPGQYIGWNTNTSQWEPMATTVGTVTNINSGTGLTGGPITSNGTLNVDVGTAANKILQVTSSSQYPTLDGNLISNINAVKLQTRNVSASAPSGGQMLGWNATTNVWEPSNVTTGTVMNITSGSGLLGGPITSLGTLSVDTGTTANKILQLTPSAQIPAVDGFLVSNINAAKLKGVNVSGNAPVGSQVLTYNATTLQWEAQPTQTNANVFVNGGNSFGAPASLGTSDSQSLTLVTSNVGRISIDQLGNVGVGTTSQIFVSASGNVGIGTLTPNALVDINGTMRVTQICDSAGNNCKSVSGGWGAGGSVSLVSGGTGLTGGNITTNGTLNVDVGTAANQILQLDANAKVPAVDGYQLSNLNATRIGTHVIAATNPSPGQYIGWNTSTSQWEPMATTVGTVTNITTSTGLSGGPITATGTLSVDVGTAANKILQVTASAQYPTLDGFLISNINAVKLQARNVSASAPAGGQMLGWNALSNVWEPSNVTSGTVVSIASGSGLLGGPITNNGTLSVDVGTAANKILQLDVNAKVPAVDGYQLSNLNATRIGTHVIAATNPSPGQYIGWNTNTSQWEPMATTVGTVTNISSGTGLTGGPVTSNGTLNVDVGTAANKILQVTTSVQYPALDGNLISNINAVKLQARNISASAPSGGQMLGWNATTNVWEPSNVTSGTVVSIASGAGLLGGPITNNGTLSVDVGTAANKVLQLSPNAQIPVVDGFLVSNINAAKLKGVNVSGNAPSGSQVLTYNATTLQWEGQPSQTNANVFVNGGNSFGAPASLGTTDAQSLTLVTSNIGRIAIDQLGNVGVGTTSQIYVSASGNVGIGTLTPNALVDINGTMRVTQICDSAGNNCKSVAGGWGAGGSVNLVSAGAGLTGGNITTYGTLNVDVGTAANKILQLDVNAKVPAVDGYQLSNLNATRIGTHVIATTNPSPGQYIGWNTNTSQWEPMATTVGTVTNITSGTGLTGGPITNNGTLNVDVGTAANKILQVTPSVQYPVLDGFLISNINAVKLQARNVSASAPAGGQMLGWNASTNVWEPSNVTNGTVVSITSGSGLLGGPITNNGTLSVDVGTAANKIMQVTVNGQAPGVDGNLLTNITASKIQGYGVVAGTPGVSSVLTYNSTIGQWQALAPATNGTVTDVVGGTGMTGGPVTSTGTLGVDVGTTANKILQLTVNAQAPGVDGNLLTNITASNIRNRNVSASAPADTQLLIYNSTTATWNPSTLTGDATVTNNGAVTVAKIQGIGVVGGTPGASSVLTYNSTISQWQALAPASNGSVTDVVGGTGMTGGPVTSTGTLGVDVGTTANKIMQLTPSAQAPGVDGYLLTNVTASNIRNRNVSASAPADTQVLIYNSTTATWNPSTLTGDATISNNGAVNVAKIQGIGVLGGTPGASTVLTYNSTINQWQALAPANNGSVTDVVGGTGMTGGPVTSTGTLSVDVGTAANKIMQLTVNAQAPAVDGFLLTNINAASIHSFPLTASSTGTAAAPAYSFSGSTNTGMYSLAAGQMDFATTGTQRLNIDQLGNVGIGTTCAMYVTSSGNIGIGTVTPNALLDVEGIMRVSQICDTTGNNCKAISGGWGAGGSVNLVSAGTGLTGGNITTYGTINIDVGTSGNKIMQLTVNSQAPAVDGNLLTNITASKIQGYGVVAGAPGASTVLTYNSTISQWQALAPATNGTVTDVVAGTGMTGGPVTGTGTLGVDVGTAANKILQLTVNAQVPGVDGFLISNINAVKLQARNVSASTPAGGQMLGWNANTNVWEPSNVTNGTVVSITTTTGLLGGPITNNGTLSVDVGTAANKILQLDVNAKVPAVDGYQLSNLNATRIGTHVIATTNPNPGQYIGWNNNTSQWEPMATTLGTVTNITSGIGLTGGPITNNGTLNVDVGTAANKLMQLTVNAQAPGVDGNLLTNITASKIQGVGVVAGVPGASTVLTYNGTISQWQALAPASSGTVTDVVAGTGMTGGPVTGTGTLGVDVGTAANKILQLTVNAQAPAVDGFLLTNINAASLHGFPLIASPTGTAAAPAYSFSGTTNTGLFSLSAGNIGLATAGTQRLNIDQLGNVGIGTTSAIYVTSSGNIGVGTLTPNALLDVEGIMRVSQICDTTGNNCKAVSGGWGAGGSVNLVSAGTGLTGGNITTFGTINIDVGSTANKIMQLTVNAQAPSVDGNLLTNITASKIQGYGVVAGTPGVSTVLTYNSTISQWQALAPATNGTVTDVVAGTGMTGGPVIGTGTLGVDVGTTANKILQLTPGAQAPGVDGNLLTNITASNIRNRNVSASAPADTQVLIYNSTTATWNPSTVTGDATITNNGAITVAKIQGIGVVSGTPGASTVLTYNSTLGQWQALPPSNSGTVTDVVAGTGMTGGPVIGTGTLGVDIGTTANKIMQLTPGAQAPGVDGNLLTNITASNIRNRNVSASAPADTQVLIYNSTTATWNPSTVTGDATITNNGGITVAKIQGVGVVSGTPGASTVLTYNGTLGQWQALAPASNGTVTDVVAGTGMTGGPVIGTGTLGVDIGTTANKIMQLTPGAQAPGVDGYLLTNISASNIRNRFVSATAPTDAQVLVYNATTATWVPESHTGDVSMTNLGAFTVAKIQGIGVVSGTPGASTVLTYNGTLGQWQALAPASNGTVTDVVAGTGMTGGPVIGTGTLGVDIGTTANKIMQLTPSAQAPGVDGNLLTNITASNIRNRNVSASAPADTQVLIYNSTTATWNPSTVTGDATITNNGAITVAKIQGVGVVSGTPGASTVLTYNGTLGQWQALAPANNGTVTDVVAGTGMTGGPVIGTGTLGVDIGTTANKIMQLTPGAQAPGVDGYLLTNISASNIRNRFVSATAPTDAQVLVYNATTATWVSESHTGDVSMTNLGVFTVAKIQGIGVVSGTPGASTVLTYNGTLGQWQALAPASNGTVTDVVAGTGMTGGPVIGTGTLGVDIGTTANKIMQLTPGAQAPGVDGNLLTNITASNIRNRNVSASAPADTQVLIYNSTTSTWNPSTLTGDATITNNGGITVAKIQGVGVVSGTPGASTVLTYNGTLGQWQALAPSSNGTVTDVVAGTGMTGGPVIGTGTLGVDIGTTANKIMQLTPGAQAPGVDGNLLTNITASNIRNRNVSASAPADTQVLIYNSTTATWNPSTVTGDATITNNGSITVAKIQGVGVVSGTPGASTVLTYNGTLGQWQALAPASNGTVTDVVAGTGMTGGPVIGTGTLGVDIGTTANKIMQLTPGAQAPGVDGYLLTNITASNIRNRFVSATAPTDAQVLVYNATTATWVSESHTGDVSMTNLGVFTVAKIQGIGVVSGTPGASTVLTYNGTLGQWQALAPASNGTVTDVVAGTGMTGGPVIGTGTLGVDIGTTANKIMQLTPGAQAPGVDGYLLTNITASNIRNRFVSATAPTDAQVLVYNATTATWVPESHTGDVSMTNLGVVTVAKIQGIGVVSGTPGASTVLTYNGTLGQWQALAPASNGTVTDVVAGTGMTGGPVIGTGTLGVDIGTTANKIMQLTPGAQAPAVDGFLLTNINTSNLHYPLLASPTGSAAAPPYSFSGSSNTGMFSSSAGTVSLATAGTQRLTVDQLGNVGIGTTSQLYVSNSGYVGIGSTAPSAPLVVNNPGDNRNAARFYGFGTGYLELNHDGMDAFQAGGADGNVYLNYYSAGNVYLRNLSFVVQGSTGNIGLGTDTPAGRMDVEGSGAVILNAGNVGIGTTTPNAILDIVATGTVSSAIIVPRDTTANRPTAAVNGMVRYNTSTGDLEGFLNGQWLTFLNSAGGVGFVNGGNGFGSNAVLGTTDNFSLSIKTNNHQRINIDNLGNVGIGSTSSIFLSTSSGNVGIGTLTPASTLTVAGTIQTLSGGVTFPDGTTQTTASMSSSCDTHTYTTTGANTWTKPGCGTVVRVECWGGGGGGGSGFNGSGGGAGGAGGGYFAQVFPKVMLGASETVTVGAGGAGGAQGNGNAGTSGGNTSFGSWAVAQGGTGGFGGQNSTFVAGPVGVAGGGSGGAGVSSGLGSAGVNGGWCAGGGGAGGGVGASGGSASCGGGAGGSSPGAGNNGTTPSGGGGGGDNNGTTGLAGGTGGNGKCIVTTY